MALVKPQKPAPILCTEKIKLAVRGFANSNFLQKCFLNIWCLLPSQMVKQEGITKTDNLTLALERGTLSVMAGFVLWTTREEHRGWAH